MPGKTADGEGAQTLSLRLFLVGSVDKTAVHEGQPWSASWVTAGEGECGNQQYGVWMATTVTTLAAFFIATKGIKQQRKSFIQLTALGYRAPWERSMRLLVTLHPSCRMHSRSRELQEQKLQEQSTNAGVQAAFSFSSAEDPSP